MMQTPASPCLRYRLFFALKPPHGVARRTDHLAAALAEGVPRIRTEHQHITLAITGDHAAYPREAACRLLQAAETIMAAPFHLRLDRLSFSTRSAALRPSRAVQGLNALQRALVRAIEEAGVMLRTGWRFSPHQTLFYRAGPVGHRPVEGFGWCVEDFALICSHVGRTRHEELGRWPLKGGAQLSLF
ncbi:2'-5' RNA ligase family protein [Sphingobium cloacae]|uniref:2'-5' RNA ligase n=1 Tax=Sphingobium cloacae TaxID=120107 RepID=A0A1E1F2I3_9SPHN|nr:2'-5' RNA ligase family protein [Sphingobium cloacae]BAV64733.1 2'-5' RNA ligase [Sphingobium cloacae]